MKIILLYGPPSSGKGTHARLLKEFFGYEIIEPAHIFRKIANSPNHKYSKIMADQINYGFPAPTKIYTEIVQAEVERVLRHNKSFILDKPGGSLINEAKKFVKYTDPFNPEIYLCILDITLLESLKRINTRYFIESTGESYITYKDALSHAPKNEKPIKRADDTDSKKVMRRYNRLYKDRKSAILKLYTDIGAHIIELDGTQSILTVQKSLRNFIT